MAKFLQVVAVMLIGAVLGSTLCVEMCSLVSVERQAKASPAAEFDMPCHHDRGQEDSKLPASDLPCSHRDFVAEKLSKTSSIDDLRAISFIAVRDVFEIILVKIDSPLALVDETFPRFSPSNLSSILRI